MTRNVTLREAQERIDEIRGVYAPEELRVEANFIAVLLPSSLSLLVSTWAPDGGNSWTIPILTFFGTYLLLVLYDLVVITGRNSAAKQIQTQIYRLMNSSVDVSGEGLPDDLAAAYAKVDETAARRGYIPPMAKVIIAAVMGAGALIIL